MGAAARRAGSESYSGMSNATHLVVSDTDRRGYDLRVSERSFFSRHAAPRRPRSLSWNPTVFCLAECSALLSMLLPANSRWLQAAERRKADQESRCGGATAFLVSFPSLR